MASTCGNRGWMWPGDSSRLRSLALSLALYLALGSRHRIPLLPWSIARGAVLGAVAISLRTGLRLRRSIFQGGGCQFATLSIRRTLAVDGDRGGGLEAGDEHPRAEGLPGAAGHAASPPVTGGRVRRRSKTRSRR